MLPYSIKTFRRAFGDAARYVVTTDRPSEMSSLLGPNIEIYPLDLFTDTPFAIRTVATWRKWCPPRLAPELTEFHVDADVFLLGDPRELRALDESGAGPRYLVMQESEGSGYWIGSFAKRIVQGIPPVNTGLVGQRAGTDITKKLMQELQWWLINVPQSQRQFHDDQGAITTVLSKHYLNGQVDLLPQDRYRIVNNKVNAGLQTLDGVTVLHATGPHTAFERFRGEVVRAAEGLGD